MIQSFFNGQRPEEQQNTEQHVVEKQDNPVTQEAPVVEAESPAQPEPPKTFMVYIPSNKVSYDEEKLPSSDRKQKIMTLWVNGQKSRLACDKQVEVTRDQLEVLMNGPCPHFRDLLAE